MKAKASLGTVRIIGGKWRSRRLHVPMQGVRPTPDSVKETLFNWISSNLPGAICLDLFAGTGALGFEALSRGAARVDMVDGSHQVVEALKQQAQTFATQDAVIYQLKLPEGLLCLPAQRYDLVFIDAPFRQKLLLPCCQSLDEHQRLISGAYVYLEMEKEIMPLSLPVHWVLYRSKVSGQVAYCLYRVE